MMPKQTCAVSGEEFEVSDLEIKLREKFGFTDLPTTAPWMRLRELGSFWQHWNLHNRKCDKTGKNIISVFSEKCPYPVWHKDVWIKENNPPFLSCHSGLDLESNKKEVGPDFHQDEGLSTTHTSSDNHFDFSRDFFSQAWELFQKCPIPHNFQSHNENCEYTDDWYRSKNCYLCHSGQNNEDLKYSYGCDSCRDLNYSGRAFDSELGMDLINSHNCFDVIYVLYSRNIQASAFLYDCRNCADCMFCFNLRNKKYYFGNKQFSREEYEKKKAQWNLKSREIYDKAKAFFVDMMGNKAWHKFQNIDHAEKTFGNYVSHVKSCENCFLLTKHEDCVNVAFSGPSGRSLLDSLGTVGAELAYKSSLPVYSYDVRFCFSVDNSKYCEYSAFLKNCQNCFGCCGLVGKKYCIFNKQYSSEEYKKLREKIIFQMKEAGNWGESFPGYFAPNPYDESWASFYWPLSVDEQKKFGFRLSELNERKNDHYLPTSEIPDSVDDIEDEKALCQKIFWDEKYQRPFRILPADIKFSRKLGCPLPNSYYMRRIQENFAWMPFDGKLRNLNCGKCAKKIQTSWPKKYDKRVLCETCYLEILN